MECVHIKNNTINVTINLINSMTTNFKLVQTPQVSLYSGISAVAASLTVTPYPRDLDGNKLTMVDFGTVGRLTIDPKVTSYEEICDFTGMVDNGDNTCTLTGLGRDLISKSPYNTYGTGKVHGASAVVVFSDNPQAYFEFGALRNDNSWSRINDFALSPTVPTPTNPTDVANKAYVDNGLLSGGADMSTTVKGIGRTSTSPNKTIGTFTVTIASPAVFTSNSHGLTANDTVQFTTTGLLPTGISVSTTYYVIATGLTANTFEIAATLGGTAINTSGSQSGTHTLVRTTPYVVNDQDTRLPTQGENDALVGNNIDIAVGTGNKFMTQTGLQHNAEKYAADAGANDTYVIILSPIPTSYTNGMVVYFKANTANTGAATINVNSLGAKTIVKGVNTALSDNDILAGQFITIIYDGTNFVLQNPVGINQTAIMRTGNTTHTMSSTTTTTIAHGLGVIPKLITMQVNCSTGSAAGIQSSIVSSIGYYDGTTQNCNFVAVSSNGSTSSAGQDTSHIIHYANGASAGAGSDNLVGTATFDATNITITWAATASPSGTGNIIWTAQA